MSSAVDYFSGFPGAPLHVVGIERDQRPTRPRVSVVIPTKNEANNIGWVISRLTDVDELVLVDANSTDGTVEIVRSLRPDAVIMQQPRPGKGVALAAGLLKASGDVVIMLDADGSMDPAEIPGMVGALLAGADVVKGSRTAPGGGSHDLSTLRATGNWALTITANALFGQRWSELCYGMAAFWRDVIPLLELETVINANPTSERGKPYGHGFEIEALLFCRAARRGLRVAETFSWEHPRMHGDSNLSAFRDGWRVLGAIARERREPKATGITPAPVSRAYPIVPHIHHATRRVDRRVTESASDRARIMVVGPGDRFISGVSQYTARLSHALADEAEVSVLLLRKLCPEFVYPGRERIGKVDHSLTYPRVPVFDGLDWYWGTGRLHAASFLRAQMPDTVVLQWWTGTVAHSLISLARQARSQGARVVLEMHETLDVGEAAIGAAARYSENAMSKLLSYVDAIVVHSNHDVDWVQRVYAVPDHVSVEVIGCGPYDSIADLAGEVAPRADDGTLRLLYTGVIRPYKGLDDLAEAMRIALERGDDVHLKVVGEVWQGYRAPLDALANLPGNRVEIIEGYVSDEEFARNMAEADAIVLPYRRSSASGPLHTAMSLGKPVLTTAVGGLIQATDGYSGAVLVPAADPVALADGFASLRPLTDRVHDDPASWEAAVEKFLNLHARLAN